MEFTETPLRGAYLIDIKPYQDSRGFFARTFCVEEFAQHGLETGLMQCNVSFNRVMGTLRGLHHQAAPHEEAKLVRCTMGAIWDAIVDIREGSETYAHWFAVELTAQNRRALYVPKGFAHGFQVLADDTEVFYQMSCMHQPASARGIHYADPTLRIAWPLAVANLSDHDARLPTLRTDI
jgi:dTDP-4-dehydrorhamnose 3,5-epimerase